MWASLILTLLAHGPEYLGDVEAVVNSIAQGEGGAVKLASVADGLSHLMTHTAAAIVGLDQQPQPQVQPQASTSGDPAGPGPVL